MELSRRRFRPEFSPAVALLSPSASSPASLLLSVSVDDDADGATLAAFRPPSKNSDANTFDGFRDMEVSNTGDRKAWRRPLAPACSCRRKGTMYRWMRARYVGEYFARVSSNIQQESDLAQGGAV